MENNYLERFAKMEERAEIHDKKIDQLELKIDKIEIKMDNIHDLAVSVKELAVEMKAIREDLNKIDNRVLAIEEKPSKRWEQVIGYIISGIVGLLVGYFGMKLGLK